MVELWEELLDNVKKAFLESSEIIEKENIENIPGAKERLVRRFQDLAFYLPRNNGELLIKAIDHSISNSFFPRTDDLAEAFRKILKARTHEQDFIINELINGFIVSQSKALGLYSEGQILNKLVEAFKKSRTFLINDYSFFAMFGDPNKPRKNLRKQLDKLADFLGLIKQEKSVKDIATGQQRVVSYYTFPPEMIDILEEEEYVYFTEKGEAIVSDHFDKNVFICALLARYAVDRKDLDKYKVNGICAIFALILLLSFMPKVNIDETSPLMRDKSFDPEHMSVIPKSWLMKDVLIKLLPPLIDVVAFRLGEMEWYEKIERSENQRKIHLQTRFLIKDVNKWVLGNLCRVEVPIFVEISSIFQEVTLTSDTDSEE